MQNYLIEVKGANVSREIVGSVEQAMKVASSCLQEGYSVTVTPTPLPTTTKSGSACLAYVHVAQFDMFKSPLRLVS